MDHGRTTRQRGFSLVELMVVITIIGLLASIVGTYVFRYLAKARIETAKQQMTQFEDNIKLYMMEHKKLPESLDDLFGEDAPMGEGEVPKDPWNGDYQYQVVSRTKYDLLCFGADGVEGGEGEEADITLEDLHKSGADDEGK